MWAGCVREGDFVLVGRACLGCLCCLGGGVLVVLVVCLCVGRACGACCVYVCRVCVWCVLCVCV